ncbi:efflux RND transporter periplasmic adaptor subunit [Curvivirga sp.]|uniref:efflux RND transporter periplasmic adaptor subunit n=1 Tax=Curvivirga sp. TaxID=2856848 RepID=UPI003B5CDA7D
MKNITKIVSAAVLGLILISPLQSVLAQGQQAALVGVDEVQGEPLGQTIPVLGRLVAQQRSQVAALVDGPIEKMDVQIGDRVVKGDTLVVLDDRRIRQSRNLQAAMLQQAKASLKAALDQKALTEQELVRLERLQSSAAFSPARLEDKQLELARFTSQVSVAEAEVAAAQVNLSLAEIDLARTVIKAPFNGVVTEKNTEVGSYVSQGDAVLSLINHEDLEVEADVPSNRLVGLENGRLIDVDLSGQNYEAIVRAVVPDENVLTRTRAVRFTLGADDNALETLAAGQSATVYIPVGSTRQVMTVHKDALIAKGDGYIAYVVENGIANIRPVTVGDAVGQRFEVMTGLNAGDIVVIRGNERLFPGQAVQYPNMPKAEESGS